MTPNRKNLSDSRGNALGIGIFLFFLHMLGVNRTCELVWLISFFYALFKFHFFKETAQENSRAVSCRSYIPYYLICSAAASATFAIAASMPSGFLPPAWAIFGRPPPPPPTRAAISRIRLPA